jgi:hypothetical protein
MSSIHDLRPREAAVLKHCPTKIPFYAASFGVIGRISRRLRRAGYIQVQMHGSAVYARRTTPGKEQGNEAGEL